MTKLFIQYGSYLIFAVLVLAGWAVLWYGRGRAHEQSRVANLIDRGIL